MSEIPSEPIETPDRPIPHPDRSASYFITAVCLGFLIATIAGKLHPYDAFFSGLALGAAILLIQQSEAQLP